MKSAIRILLYFLILALFLSSSLAIYANGLNSITMPYPVFHKGMSYVTWSKESFASKFSDDSLLIMKKCGVESVAIVVTWYQDHYNSTEIRATDRTPSDSSVRHAIRKAHEYGMKVMLKPHIDLISDEGSNRSDIGFNTSDKWRNWFASYMSFIAHYTRMARDEDAEFFCVGTELTFASQQEGFWRDSVIRDVRRIFKGQITYAANWDEYRDVKFWDLLDYVGIDAYFPLAQKSNATSDELVSGWKNWLAEIEAFQRRVKKPIIFTESGYCSAGTASNKPWEDALKTRPNTLLQKECYKALIETFWDKPWFFGIYWWAWNTYPQSGSENNSSFTPQNKPAMEYLKTAYRRPLTQKLTFIISYSESTPENPELIGKLSVEAAKCGARGAFGTGNIGFTGELARRKSSFDHR